MSTNLDNIENLDLIDYATDLGDFLNGRAELQQIWDCFDVDSNGYIEDKEFHDLLYLCLAIFITQNAQEDEINDVPIPEYKDLEVTIKNLQQALMPKLDIDKDGKISREEFEKLGTYLLEEYDAIQGNQKITGGSGLARAAEEIYIEVVNLPRGELLDMKGTTLYVGDQIISYESEDFVYFKVFYQLQGTILKSGNLWYKMTLLSIILAIGFVAAHLLMNSSGFDVNGLRTFMGGLDALLAFFAGLYLAQILDRWWVMRSEGIAGLVSAITDLSLALSGLLHEGTAEEENVKKLTLRYGLLTHALIYAEAQDRFINMKDDIWDELRAKGLITYKEEKVLKKIRKKPEAVWGWILCYLRTMSADDGLLPEDRFEHFAEICRAGRRACSLTALHIRCQLPLPYVHLICIVINLYQTILAFCSGLIISYAVRVNSDQEIVVQLTIFVLYCIIYQGILETADKMVNPLGTDDIDFPQLYIHLQLQDECKALYDASVELPWEKNKRTLKKKSAQEDSPYMDHEMAIE